MIGEFSKNFLRVQTLLRIQFSFFMLFCDGTRFSTAHVERGSRDAVSYTLYHYDGVQIN